MLVCVCLNPPFDNRCPGEIHAVSSRISIPEKKINLHNTIPSGTQYKYAVQASFLCSLSNTVAVSGHSCHPTAFARLRSAPPGHHQAIIGIGFERCGGCKETWRWRKPNVLPHAPSCGSSLGCIDLQKILLLPSDGARAIQQRM